MRTGRELGALPAHGRSSQVHGAVETSRNFSVTWCHLQRDGGVFCKIGREVEGTARMCPTRVLG